MSKISLRIVSKMIKTFYTSEDIKRLKKFLKEACNNDVTTTFIPLDGSSVRQVPLQNLSDLILHKPQMSFSKIGRQYASNKGSDKASSLSAEAFSNI